jgi:hypothetical protein
VQALTSNGDVSVSVNVYHWNKTNEANNQAKKKEGNHQLNIKTFPYCPTRLGC